MKLANLAVGAWANASMTPLLSGESAGEGPFLQGVPPVGAQIVETPNKSCGSLCCRGVSTHTQVTGRFRLVLLSGRSGRDALRSVGRLRVDRVKECQGVVAIPMA